MSWPAYQGASSKCSGRAQPGANALMAVGVADYGASNMGIYVCRSVRGSADRSVHGDGRALDFGYRSIAAGNRLLLILLKHRMALGIQLIIYNRRIYSAKAPNGAAYQGVNSHTDHLHVELTWNAATSLTPSRIRQILAGSNIPTPIVPATPPPTAPVDMAAVRRLAARLARNAYQQAPNLDPNQPRTDVNKWWTVALQEALNVATGANLSKDGIYGQSTANAVANFQAIMNAGGKRINDWPGAAHAETRWWLCVLLDEIAEGKR